MKKIIIVSIIMTLFIPVVSFGYTEAEKREMMKQSPQQHSTEDYAAMIVNRGICNAVDWLRSTGLVPEYRNKWNSWVREQEIKQQEFERKNKR